MKNKPEICFLIMGIVGGMALGAAIASLTTHYSAKGQAEWAIFDDENVEMVVACKEQDRAAKALDYTLDRESKTLWIKFDGNKLVKMKPKEIHPYYYQWVEVDDVR